MRVAVAAFLLAACATPSPDVGGARDRNAATAELIAALEARGIRVEDAGTVEQPFFTVPAQVFIADGDDLQVYQFASEEAAGEAAATVSDDGRTIGTSKPSWLAPPHVFRRGRLLVIYLGSREATLAALRDTLGPELAGG